MKYTDYFKEQFNDTKKIKSLPQKEVHRLLSIAHAEINLANNKNYPQERYRYTKEINRLANNLTPEQLWNKIKKSM